MLGKSILLVGGTQALRDMITQTLGKSYFVMQAENGSTAQELMSKDKFDLIMSDISLPDIIGFNFLRTVLSDKDTKNIPILAIVGSDESENQLRAMTLGVTDILIKPLQAPVLCRRVKNIMDLFSDPFHSEQNRLSEENALLKSQLDAVLSATKSGSYRLRYSRATMKVVQLSNAFYKLRGIEPNKAALKTADYIHPEDFELVNSIVTNAIDKKLACVQWDSRVATKGGIKFLHCVCALQYFDKECILEIVEIDMTENRILRLELERAISAQTTKTVSSSGDSTEDIDPLTGLYVRKAMAARVDKSLGGNNDSSSALFVANIENLKSLNDNFGYDFGDSVLVGIATKMRKIFRGEDILCRIEGNEFCVFVDNALPRDIVDMRAKQVISSISKQYSNWRCKVDISVGVGVAITSRNGSTDNFDSLYALAHSAMKNSKVLGSNNYVIIQQ